MTRYILEEEKIHPSIRQEISDNHRDFVEKVIRDVENNDIVVLGSLEGRPAQEKYNEDRWHNMSFQSANCDVLSVL